MPHQLPRFGTRGSGHRGKPGPVTANRSPDFNFQALFERDFPLDSRTFRLPPPTVTSQPSANTATITSAPATTANIVPMPNIASMLDPRYSRGVTPRGNQGDGEETVTALTPFEETMGQLESGQFENDLWDGLFSSEQLTLIRTAANQGIIGEKYFVKFTRIMNELIRMQSEASATGDEAGVMAIEKYITEVENQLSDLEGMQIAFKAASGDPGNSFSDEGTQIIADTLDVPEGDVAFLPSGAILATLESRLRVREERLRQEGINARDDKVHQRIVQAFGETLSTLEDFPWTAGAFAELSSGTRQLILDDYFTQRDAQEAYQRRVKAMRAFFTEGPPEDPLPEQPRAAGRALDLRGKPTFTSNLFPNFTPKQLASFSQENFGDMLFRAREREALAGYGRALAPFFPGQDAASLQHLPASVVQSLIAAQAQRRGAGRPSAVLTPPRLRLS
jgi:hypothetical protein